jgi:hypothetical protein
MGRGMIVLLMVVWGHLVLFALFGGIVSVVLAARGDLLQAALLGAGCAGLVATAQAIERFAVLKRYGTRARGRRLTFRRVAARAGRIVVAAAIVGLVGISANQVRVIADVGVADWLEGKRRRCSRSWSSSWRCISSCSSSPGRCGAPAST